MLPRLTPLAAATVFALALACLGHLSATPAAVAASHVAATAPKTAVGGGGSWPVYHHDNAHTGYDPAAPTLGGVSPTSGWTENVLDEEVYAEPLIHGGRVFSVTLNNTVYAIDQGTGAIVWSKNLGAPQTGGWVCGNVAPQGIIGTPVIDTAVNRIYAVALIGGSPPIYHLFGLDLANGNILLDTPIAPAGFTWEIQQQRGALGLANGFVYVPFGGRAGDCFRGVTPYYAWVVGVPTSGVGAPNVWRGPSGGAGAWAAGGVVVDDVSHNVFFATGNAIPCNGSVLSDAIVRLSPTLTTPDYFEPNDWHANWCGPDSDLGSASPVLISPTLMFTAGKRGGGFLLDPTNLGGVNGQLYPPRSPYAQAEACLGVHADATFASFAYAAPFVYVECETPSGGNGLVALNVNTGAPSFTPCTASCPSPDWHAGGTTRFGPPIVAAGAVWVAGDGVGLHAYNATTGAVIYQSAAFGVNRFVTPAEAGGQVFVPSHNVIKSFSLTPVSFTPSRLDFNAQVPGTTSTGHTVTLRIGQTVTLNISTVGITGANPSAYTKVTDTCTAMAIAPGWTCSVQVTFRPTGYGGFPAMLSFNDDAAGSPHTVPLNGLGAIDNRGHLYTLDGYGGLHADGSAPPLSSSGYWPGYNIARSMALFPDGLGGYMLDGYGGVHPIGNANPVGPVAFWGWDIARQIVLAPWASAANPAGWTLDGWGGVHPFGGAPAVSGVAFWNGWDIARGLAILPDSTPSSVAGYTLDGWGGVHPFGGAPQVSNVPYWPGWDIARGFTLSPNASKTNPAGWTLDGWGGVHEFGSAQAVTTTGYWPYWDIARGIVVWTGNGIGGWVLEGYGGIHPFGAAGSVSPVANWPGWDIANSLGGPSSGSGSRHR